MKYCTPRAYMYSLPRLTSIIIQFRLSAKYNFAVCPDEIRSPCKVEGIPEVCTEFCRYLSFASIWVETPPAYISGRVNMPLPVVELAKLCQDSSDYFCYWTSRDQQPWLERERARLVRLGIANKWTQTMLDSCYLKALEIVLILYVHPKLWPEPCLSSLILAIGRSTFSFASWGRVQGSKLL